MRGIFFSEEDADTAVRQLVSGGWTAHKAREPFAGEDDDEDHAWAVVTDAPQLQLELLVDSHDGWLDLDDERPGSPVDLPPLDLPRAPRRTTSGRVDWPD